VKKQYLAYAVIALIGAGVTALLPKAHEKWTLRSGEGDDLILSLNGKSATVQSPRLEIRCDASKSEVRLYMPIGVRPAVGGPAEGAATMGLTEEYQDENRKPIPIDDKTYGNVWSADESQAFASKLEPLLFVRRIMGQDWLTIRGAAFGDKPTGFAIDFPVMGLTDYRDKIASSCRGGGTDILP
jgi:hypothetical protein